jgi:hypothetical protein
MADLQEWVIDLEKCSATCHQAGQRLVRERAKPLDTGSIADEAAEAILSGKPARGLKWRSSTEVLVRPAAINDCWSEKKATRNGQVRRFYVQLDERLAQRGWARQPRGLYRLTEHAPERLWEAGY